VDVPEILIIVFCALAISIAASLYPAWKASRLDAVRTLRYE
jgi:lipoprotein-releasing system permease protein